MEMIHDTVNQNNENNVIMLRQAIISELDATSLYEQMAASTSNPKLAKMFLDIAKEEKVHVGEFEAMLNIIDKENEAAVKDGHEEATKKIGSFQSRISSALKNA
jgi:rubrerythrin